MVHPYSAVPDIGKFVPGRVTAVSESAVTLEDGSRLEFDFLILAPGSTYPEPAIKDFAGSLADRKAAIQVIPSMSAIAQGWCRGSSALLECCAAMRAISNCALSDQTISAMHAYCKCTALFKGPAGRTALSCLCNLAVPSAATAQTLCCWLSTRRELEIATVSLSIVE